MIERLGADIVTAMKAKDMIRLNTLRSIKSEAGNIAISSKRKEITSDDVISAVTKGIKQRQDSYASYVDADRNDLADIEKIELEILKDYLPRQLTNEDISELVDDSISTLGATTKKEMGKVMGLVMKKIEKGTADNKVVSKIVNSKLV